MVHAETASTWDQAAPIPQVLGTSDRLRALYGLERLAVAQSSQWYYPQHDAIGSVRQWTNAAGVVVGLQGYAPYGEPLVPVGPAVAPWGFTGEWQDASGLVYLRARWYHAALGRFTQVDPFSGLLSMPASRHPYLYGLANPLRFSDPTGLFPDWQQAREILEDSLEFLLGAGLQYANDMTWGLYGEAYRRARGHTLADVPSPAFQRGRQLGRGLSTAVGTMHMAVGTTAAILALKAGPPTMGGALAAATPTGGIPVAAGAILVTVEGLVVIVGAGQALYGGSVLAYAKGNPLQHSCGDDGGSGYRAGDKTPRGREFTEHGAEIANKRGFDARDIDNIIDNNIRTRVKQIDPLDGSVTWRYQDRRGNTVITNESGDGIVTVYSHPERLNRGRYIPK